MAGNIGFSSSLSHLTQFAARKITQQEALIPNDDRDYIRPDVYRHFNKNSEADYYEFTPQEMEEVNQVVADSGEGFETLESNDWHKYSKQLMAAINKTKRAILNSQGFNV